MIFHGSVLVGIIVGKNPMGANEFYILGPDGRRSNYYINVLHPRLTLVCPD